MNISAVSSAANSIVSQLGQNTNIGSAPINQKVSDPVLMALNTNIFSNAVTRLVSQLRQNTNDTSIPEKAEVIVPPRPVNANVLPTVTSAPVAPLAQNTNTTKVPANAEITVQALTDINTAALPFTTANPITPPIENTSKVTVPDTTAPTAPDTTQAIIPPLAAFGIMSGEVMVNNPEPKEDTSGIGGHGEVAAVLPLQAIFNNAPKKPAQVKFKNSEMPVRGPSTAKRAQDYLRTIRTRARATDLEFQRQHLPYRIKVIANNNENVLIDLSILDGQGKVMKHETRNVTDADFGMLMDDISTGKGLLIDDLQG